MDNQNLWFGRGGGGDIYTAICVFLDVIWCTVFHFAAGAPNFFRFPFTRRRASAAALARQAGAQHHAIGRCGCDVLCPTTALAGEPPSQQTRNRRRASNAIARMARCVQADQKPHFRNKWAGFLLFCNFAVRFPTRTGGTAKHSCDYVMWPLQCGGPSGLCKAYTQSLPYDCPVRRCHRPQP